MNYLCICQYGHSRSVGLARLLHGLGQPAVSIGIATCGTALQQLIPWAHRILLLDMAFQGSIPTNRYVDVIDMSIGPDIWQNPYSIPMRDLLRTKFMLNRERLGFNERQLIVAWGPDR